MHPIKPHKIVLVRIPSVRSREISDRVFPASRSWSSSPPTSPTFTKTYASPLRPALELKSEERFLFSLLKQTTHTGDDHRDQRGT